MGFVKAKSFMASNNKLCYPYILTSNGLAEQAMLAGAFFERKMHEYALLKAEIDELQFEAVRPNSLKVVADPDTIPPLGTKFKLGSSSDATN